MGTPRLWALERRQEQKRRTTKKKTMADIKFTCPHCQQGIQCDQLWCGHEINCPTCQGAIMVPQTATAPAAGGAPAIKPPSSPAARLSAARRKWRVQPPPRGWRKSNFNRSPRRSRARGSSMPLSAWGSRRLGWAGTMVMGCGSRGGTRSRPPRMQPASVASVEKLRVRWTSTTRSTGPSQTVLHPH